MIDEERQLVVIGGGSAGMAAAVAAADEGVKDIVILETDPRMGGVLRQCIHDGFGLHRFGEQLTGPEFADRYLAMVKEAGIQCRTSCPVIGLSPQRVVTAVSAEEGYLNIKAGAVVFATGCRERTAGAIAIPGTRPAGVMTAGTAQRYINLEGQLPGRRVVILGSGDIGLIMARRLTLEGAKVLCVAELMPFSNGLSRNIVQCLHDYDIPLLLSHTVTRIIGCERLEGVYLSQVEADTLRPVPGSERFYDCDSLLLSVGLIPETELARECGVTVAGNSGIEVDDGLQSSAEGVFACGNVVQVHDLVDFAAAEGERAGRMAARYLRGEGRRGASIPVKAGKGVSFAVPERVCLSGDTQAELSFRVRCVMKGATVRVLAGEREIASRRRPVMRPGELEKLSVNRADIAGAEGLTVEIEGGEK